MADILHVFIEEENLRDACATADGEVFFELRESVTIYKPELYGGSCISKSLKDRTLDNTVTTPCSGKNEYVHLANKGPQ